MLYEIPFLGLGRRSQRKHLCFIWRGWLRFSVPVAKQSC